MEELLRQAFQLGQQWVQDMNNDKEPMNFNEWYASDDVQGQVKNCSNSYIRSSVISELSKDQQYYITLVSRLNKELVNNQIITPTQKNQIEKYMLERMN